MKRALLCAIGLFIAVATPANAGCGYGGVFIFRAHWCPACRAAEYFFANHDIGYRSIEVTDNPDAQQFMRSNFGTTAIPVIVVDGDYRLGYDPSWLRSALCIN